MIIGPYRVEVWHNGHVMPTNWSGTGQPTAYRTEPPTEWCALISETVSGNCKKLTFSSAQDRSRFLKTIREVEPCELIKQCQSS